MGERGRSRKGHPDVTRPRGPRGGRAERSEVRRGTLADSRSQMWRERWREVHKRRQDRARQASPEPNERPEVSQSPAEGSS